MKPIPGRCYALRGKKKAGCWCYEIGSGDRVYYKPDDASKTVKVYYAGSHPNVAPDPPKKIFNCQSDLSALRHRLTESPAKILPAVCCAVLWKIRNRFEPNIGIGDQFTEGHQRGAVR
jgi:hypothetical protein